MIVKYKIKKGDRVIITVGKDKGKIGSVILVYPKESKIVVEGVNTATKYIKPKSVSEPGSIIKKEMPIHISNVSHIDPKTGARTKVGYKLADGQKVRYAKKSGENI